MHVTITGGAGFVGRHFARALESAGHAVTVLDVNPPSWAGRSIRFVHGDVRDPTSVRTALEGCDAVLHLAAAHHDFGISRETFFSVNEQGTAVLCRALDAFNVHDVCFFSSVAVYGDAPEPRDEGCTPQPTSPYGESKLAAEQVLRRWTAQGGGRSTLVIRPTAIFGPWNTANMLTLIKQIDRGWFLQIGDGSNLKSLAYVDNLVAATLLMWFGAARPAFDVFNYVDKPDLTSREITNAICRSLRRRPPRLRIPWHLAALAVLPFDLAIAATGHNLPISSSRLRKFVRDRTRFEAAKVRDAGFRPRVSLVEGIDRMVQWYREGRSEAVPAVRRPPHKGPGSRPHTSLRPSSTR
jgi:nucleoside-diphosphate-sugar epimerase